MLSRFWYLCFSISALFAESIICYCPAYFWTKKVQMSNAVLQAKQLRVGSLQFCSCRKSPLTRASQRSNSLYVHSESYHLSWLEHLTQAANSTVRSSWADMDQFDEGSSSRSASGGTTWADGGWINTAWLSILRDVFDSAALANTDVWRWLQRSSGPVHVPLASGEGFDITLHVFPAGTVSLPWRMPTGQFKSRRSHRLLG